MAEIATYTQKVLPSASASEAPKTPVFTPIDIAAGETAAQVRLGGVIQDIGENLIKIQQHNEVLVGERYRHQFDIWMNQAVLGLQKEYQMEKAVSTKDNPGVSKVGTDLIYSEIDKRVEEYPGSDVMKNALRVHLENDANPYLKSLKTYEAGQQRQLADANFSMSQATAVTLAASGLRESGIAIIDQSLKDNYGGGSTISPILRKIAINNMDIAAEKADKEAFHTAIYGKLRQDATSESGVVDYDKAITTLLNANFQKENKITAPVKDQIFNELKAEKAYVQTLTQEAKNEAYNDELDNIGKLWVKGNITGAVNAVMGAFHINNIDKMKIIQSIQTPSPEGKSNSNSYLEGIEKMYDPQVPIEYKKTWLLSNRSKLNITDFKHLAGIGMSQELTNDKAAIKAGADEIKKALVDPRAKSMTQSERAQAAVDLYIKGVNDSHELDTPTKKRAYAKEILRLPQFNNINIREDLLNDLERMSKKVTPGPKVQSGKKLIGYQNGKPVYDIGNGQAQIGD
ncbi:MAG: hypothetical protein V1709_05805 [Planctomycetota bacterium]